MITDRDYNEYITKYIEFIEEYYSDEIEININNGHNFIYIDFKSLCEFDIDISDLLLNKAQEHIKLISFAIKNLFDIDNYEVFIKNVPDSQKRNINHIIEKDIGQLVKLRGMVSSKSENYLKTLSIKFECPSCGNEMTIPQMSDFYVEPSSCGCGRKGKFRELDKKLIDIIDINIEDLPEALKPTETTLNIKCIFLKNLAINNLKIYPGARLEVTGYLIAEQKMIERRKSNIFNFLFFACGYHNIEEADEMNNFDEEDLEVFDIIKNKSNPAKFMADIVFGDIEGNDDIKEISIIQQFSGTFTNDGKRDFLHILLVGDPGTCKTDMCLRTIGLNPNSRFSTAKNTSEVGLTASAVKDDKTKRWVVKAGLLPKCNGATIGIDEISQMPIEKQDSLRTPMETGILPFNKAGMSVTMQTATAIYGTCNPKSGLYMSEVSSISPKVIDMSQPFLDRFDMIYKISDVINPKLDEKICTNMISRNTFIDTNDTFNENDDTLSKIDNTNIPIHTTVLSINSIKKYIYYCKSKNVQSIKFSNRLYTYISCWYTGIRQRSITNSYEGKRPTPRLVESVLRLSRAIVRMKQKDTVTIKEFKMATDYFERMIGISEIEEPEIPKVSSNKISHKSIPKDWSKLGDKVLHASDYLLGEQDDM